MATESTDAASAGGRGRKELAKRASKERKWLLLWRGNANDEK